MHLREARRKRLRSDVSPTLAALVARTPVDGNLQRYLYETYVQPTTTTSKAATTATTMRSDADAATAAADAAARMADAVLCGAALRRLVADLGPEACPHGVCDVVALTRRVPRSRSSVDGGVYIAELCFAACAATAPRDTHTRRRAEAAAAPLDDTALLLQYYKHPARFAAITRCSAGAHDGENTSAEAMTGTCAACAEQWRRFMACVSAPLPMSLRVHGSEPVLRQRALRVLRRNAQLRACGVRAVDVLPHSPAHCATAMYSCSHDAYHGDAYVQRVCRTLHAASAVSFQEVVSALPALVLDVQPHHCVLDMCAAPGSKTLQLLDAMLDGGSATRHSRRAVSRGVLVCNEKDRVKATQTLPARLKRYHAANVLCTRSDATQWPRIYTVAAQQAQAHTHCDDDADESATTTTAADAAAAGVAATALPLVEQRYDRVLCDVPCSGDGTLRKERGVALTWSPRYVDALVPTQKALLLRGLDLLREGGVLVYSTCSLNPKEGEEVVCAALEVYNNSSNGSGDARVCIELLDVPALLRARGASVRSCGGVRCPDAYRGRDDGDGDGSKRVLPAGYDADKLLRVLPHMNDTGGFFVAALCKRRAPAWTAPTVVRAKLNQWMHGRLWAPVAACDAAWRSIAAFYGLDAPSSSASFAFVTAVQLPSHVTVVADDSNTSNSSSNISNTTTTTKSSGADEDDGALVPLYQLNPHGSAPRRIVLVTRGVAQLLLRSWPYKGPGVEVVSAGMRAFEAYDDRYVPQAACRWRAVVEAASFVAPRCRARTLRLHARTHRSVLLPLLREGHVYLQEHWRALLLPLPSQQQQQLHGRDDDDAAAATRTTPWASFVREGGELAALLQHEASATTARQHEHDVDADSHCTTSSSTAAAAVTERVMQLAGEELRVGGVLLGIVDDGDNDSGSGSSDGDDSDAHDATLPWYLSATLNTRKLELAVDVSLRAFALLTYYDECDMSDATSVGVHDDDEQLCQWSGCTQIDLLPAKCTHCGKTFCSQHIASAAHRCPATRNALVATCPLCQRVVPLEFALQDVNDAVTRHIDRGCRDVGTAAAERKPHAATTAATTTAAAAAPSTSSSVSFLTRAFDRILSSGNNNNNRGSSDSATTTTTHTSSAFAGVGRTLGGNHAATPAFCTVPGCPAVVGVRVQCDECGRMFCIDHRSPAQHNCSGARARVRALSSTSSHSPSPSRSTAASKGSHASSKSSGTAAAVATTTTIGELLARPGNTRATARGKATERAVDMCTPLVCVLLPPPPPPSSAAATTTTTSSNNNSSGGACVVVPIAPFFMHVPKTFALGRLVDLAVQEAALTCGEATTAARVSARQPWQLYIVTTPVHSGATAAMYPPLPLSTLVRASALASGSRAVVFVSALGALPEEAVQAVRAVQRHLN